MSPFLPIKKKKRQMGMQPSDEILNISCEVTEWINLIHIRLKHSRELDLHSQE